MATPYVTGPAYLYVGGSPIFNSLNPIGPGDTPLFLGTGERGADIAKQRAHLAVHNDIGGEVEFDEVYAGQRAFVQTILTRWNEFVLGATVELVTGNPGLGTIATRGKDEDGDIGSLLVAEGNTFCLWVAFPYAPPTGPFGTNAFPGKSYSADLPPGYRFPFARLADEPITLKAGTAPLKTNVVFKALRGFDPVKRTMICYDHDMRALLGIGIN